ncbi:MAG: UvrD-helicase domain-containing protein [Phycisphaerales bacterium]|nr:UvrD-helicase domain-containing protein [Phycisphaerales bacterium]
MVDEYQDTNHAQFIIASTVAHSHGNICVVGDPDQSIYAWRGADISNILEFESLYAGAVAVSLGQNFRSTGHIVSASAGLISHNESHRERTLHTDLPEGEKPLVFGALDERSEVKEIVDRFRKLHDEGGVPWNEMAVLYRLNSLSRVIEEVFRSSDIPHCVARGTSFYQRKEIKDALAYLRIIRNQADDISLRRIVNTPSRGIGGTSLDRVERFAARHGLTLMGALRRCDEIDSLNNRAKAAIGRFVAMVEGWQSLLSGSLIELTLAELVARILDESGLEHAMRTRGSEEDIDRLANLEELVSAAADRDGHVESQAVGEECSLPAKLAGWLESISLVADADMVDPEQGAVTLMTLHAAKGLEFEAVAIVGCEQGILPHARASDDLAELEEERRLCYVGMTRARRHLLMSHAESRTQRGIQERQMSSRFLQELPEESIQRKETPDEWSGGTGILLEVHPGQPVRHPRFGLGRVVRLGRRPQGGTITVDFVEYGHRTLQAAHASLTATDDEEMVF